MGNPETQAPLGIRHRIEDTKKNTHTHREKTKTMSNANPTETRG
jgi:hypothetical protein